jgi:hypothetical protein
LSRDPLTMSVIRGGRSVPIGIILDSPEVRQLVTLQEGRQTTADRFYRDPHTPEDASRRIHDELKDSESYLPGRKEFFAAMANAPRISVKENTRVRVLEVSKARCDYSHPEATITYVRILIIQRNFEGTAGLDMPKSLFSAVRKSQKAPTDFYWTLNNAFGVARWPRRALNNILRGGNWRLRVRLESLAIVRGSGLLRALSGDVDKRSGRTTPPALPIRRARRRGRMRS